MRSFVPSIIVALACLVLASLFQPRVTHAAGSVEMQVEHLVKQALEEYNTAMEAGDSASFLKYFASNATRETPLSRHSGRTELSRYF